MVDLLVHVVDKSDCIVFGIVLICRHILLMRSSRSLPIMDLCQSSVRKL